MKILEVHNGLSAKLVDKSNYDGMWVSSLTHSASRGLPDNELVSLRERADFVSEIRDLTDKPIFVDIDTGGSVEHLPFVMQWFEKAGATVVIMEDKKFPKQNSLLEDATQHMEDVDVFCEKIRVAKRATKELLLYARLESLIAKKSVFEAALRAEAYIDAGVDGILVHSKEKIEAKEVIEVANLIHQRHITLPLAAVPTTYKLPEEHPFNVVIEANHLLRASMKAMQKYIDGNEPELASVQEIFDLVGH